MPEDQIKLAFSKVKQDIQTIFDELLNIKKELSENKENVKEILLRLESIKDGKKKQKEGISTGNDGANQSINHLINQSITNQSINQSLARRKTQKFNCRYKQNFFIFVKTRTKTFFNNISVGRRKYRAVL